MCLDGCECPQCLDEYLAVDYFSYDIVSEYPPANPDDEEEDNKPILPGDQL